MNYATTPACSPAMEQLYEFVGSELIIDKNSLMVWMYVSNALGIAHKAAEISASCQNLVQAYSN